MPSNFTLFKSTAPLRPFFPSFPFFLRLQHFLQIQKQQHSSSSSAAMPIMMIAHMGTAKGKQARNNADVLEIKIGHITQYNINWPRHEGLVEPLKSFNLIHHKNYKLQKIPPSHQNVSGVGLGVPPATATTWDGKKTTGFLHDGTLARYIFQNDSFRHSSLVIRQPKRHNSLKYLFKIENFLGTY